MYISHSQGTFPMLFLGHFCGSAGLGGWSQAGAAGSCNPHQILGPASWEMPSEQRFELYSSHVTDLLVTLDKAYHYLKARRGNNAN